MEGGREHSSVADLSTGTSIAGYRIEAVLGHGSMGTVYSALEVSLERRVALKVLTPELSRDERFRDRFLRESKVAASLEHPHIVPIHAAGEADGVLYLAMRYVEGRDLSGLLESIGRLDPERALGLLGQIASALDAAHARGLVHRDVKPANILISRPGGGHEHPTSATSVSPSTPRPSRASPAPARSSARSTTWRRSRSRGSRWTAASTSTRSAASSTSA
jgi:serine/threonine protein kinase